MINTDYFNIEEYYNDEQILIKNSTKEWVDKVVKPNIDKYYQKGETPSFLHKELAEIGAYGLIIPEEYGGTEADWISYGIMMQELEKGDTSVRVMSSIQTSMVMYAIWKFGSKEQKEKYLPKLASGKLLGGFGLTEPNHGSHTKGMHSHFKEEGENIKLTGSKLWIGNATTADIIITWAKNEKKEIQGIIVETKDLKNFTKSKTHEKWSLRASVTGELSFSETPIPKSQILQKSKTIKEALECVNIGRYAIAWGSVGVAIDCYETALKYSQERIQFNKPIASYQLTQKKLAEMITEITKAQLINWQLGKLMNEGKVRHQQISMAKRNNVEMAHKIVRQARQILGGMGISGEYPLMRHMMNLETLITYQGTHEMHLLITGRDITGINAILG